MSAAGHALYQAVWAFYALGPQLLICLALGHAAARRSGGSLLNWLVVGFLAAIVPVAGVIVMAILSRRPRSGPHRRAVTPSRHRLTGTIANTSAMADQTAAQSERGEAGDSGTAAGADTPPRRDAPSPASPNSTIQPTAPSTHPTAS